MSSVYPHKKESIRMLNEVLTAELTAVNQYFVHAEMYHSWGYERLYKLVRKHAIGEMIHAEKLIERVLYLGGIPNVQRLGKINLGENVEECMKLDQALELEAIPRLNEFVAELRRLGDNGTAELIVHVLTEEEEHIDWIDAQLDQIKQMGLANYLATQVRSEG